MSVIAAHTGLVAALPLSLFRRRSGSSDRRRHEARRDRSFVEAGVSVRRVRVFRFLQGRRDLDLVVGVSVDWTSSSALGEVRNGGQSGSDRELGGSVRRA
jgi:hypothetical protein